MRGLCASLVTLGARSSVGSELDFSDEDVGPGGMAWVKQGHSPAGRRNGAGLGGVYEQESRAG